jgi:hypothetical protein
LKNEFSKLIESEVIITIPININISKNWNYDVIGNVWVDFELDEDKILNKILKEQKEIYNKEIENFVAKVDNFIKLGGEWNCW